MSSVLILEKSEGHLLTKEFSFHFFFFFAAAAYLVTNLSRTSINFEHAVYKKIKVEMFSEKTTISYSLTWKKVQFLKYRFFHSYE